MKIPFIPALLSVSLVFSCLGLSQTSGETKAPTQEQEAQASKIKDLIKSSLGDNPSYDQVIKFLDNYLKSNQNSATSIAEVTNYLIIDQNAPVNFATALVGSIGGRDKVDILSSANSLSWVRFIERVTAPGGVDSSLDLNKILEIINKRVESINVNNTLTTSQGTTINN